MHAPTTDTAIPATGQAYRDARRAYGEASDALEAAAIAAAAYRIRQLYPTVASITADSFCNEDGDDVLRLRGIWDQGGRRLAAVDDDADDALKLRDDPDNDKAVGLAYDSVDGLLAWLPDLDYEYRGDKRHTIELPTPAPATI